MLCVGESSGRSPTSGSPSNGMWCGALIFVSVCLKNNGTHNCIDYDIWHSYDVMVINWMQSNVNEYMVGTFRSYKVQFHWLKCLTMAFYTLSYDITIPVTWQQTNDCAHCKVEDFANVHLSYSNLQMSSTWHYIKIFYCAWNVWIAVFVLITAMTCRTVALLCIFQFIKHFANNFIGVRVNT